MKRTLSLIIVLGMLLSAIPLNSVFAKEEYLFYDSFEAGMANWDYYQSGTRDNSKIVKGNASDRKMALQINDDLTTAVVGVQSKRIDITPDKTYFVAVDIYHELGKSLKMTVNMVDGNGTTVETIGLATSNTQKWETASASIYAPSSAVGLVLILAGVKADLSVDYVDNVKVEEAEVTSSGEVVGADKYGPQKGDIVYSESFEEGIGDFKVNEPRVGVCFEASQEQASDGKSSLYIWDDYDNLLASTAGSYIQISEFRKYQITYDMYAVEDKTQVQVRLYDANKTEMYRASQWSESGTKRWQTYKINVSAYPGASTIKIIVGGNTATKTKAYVDNIKITDMGSLGTIDQASVKLKNDLNYRLSVAKPGDVIEIEDGVYEHVPLKIPTSGTAEQPITLKAKNPGKVILKGFSGINITGSHIIIEGLIFENVVTVPDIIYFTKTTSYCHLKDCAILDSSAEDYVTEQRWVGFSGFGHKVTGCYFRGKSSKGLMLELGVITSVPTPGNYLVENCYFGDYKFGIINGLEVIRIGLSTVWNVDSNSIIRNCFFEKCDGESEIISAKSSGNQFYNNTFYNSNGGMWARHGDNNEFTGNLFIGDGTKDRDTGITVYGENHIVKNNYFYNLPLTSPSIVLKDGNGSPNWVGFLGPVINADVSNNTLVNCDIGLQVGDHSPNSVEKQNSDVPPKGKIANNAFISYKGTGNQILKGTPVLTGVEYENNYISGKAVGYEDGIPNGVNYGDFDFKVEDGYVIPSNGTGADIEEIKKTPKNPFDVIPDWMKTEFYDSGKYTFDIVKGDPFNTDFDVNSLFPKKDNEIKVIINGFGKEFDVEPQLINSRTMVPMRGIFEEFEAEVNWDEPTASATASTEHTTIKITENSDVAYVNGAEVKLDSPAVIINGRFLVPLRFISESFGANVEWFDDKTTAKITYIAPNRNIYNQVFKPQVPIENALTVYQAIQSGNDGTARNIDAVFNGGFTDKWPFKELEDGTPGYGIFDLGSVKTIDSIMLSFGSGTERVYTFSIYVSNDGINYTLVKDRLMSSGVTAGLETFDLGGVKGRYLKYVGYGSNVNTWNNIGELFIIGK